MLLIMLLVNVFPSASHPYRSFLPSYTRLNNLIEEWQMCSESRVGLQGSINSGAFTVIMCRSNVISVGGRLESASLVLVLICISGGGQAHCGAYMFGSKSPLCLGSI
jgi:hypothetical protein